MISVDDFLFFLDEALDGMVRVVAELGDDLASCRPDVDGVNSPYVTLTHCLGVMEYWGGQVIAGRAIERDRDAEFDAAGSVDELMARAHAARRQLAVDVSELEPDAPPRGALMNEADAGLPLGSSQGGALMHIYSELAIHRGHVEICRDLLLTPGLHRLTGAASPRPDSRYRQD